MFRFFRLKQKLKQDVTPSSKGIYDLTDDEVEQLIGGAPIRHLLVRPSATNAQHVVPGQQLNHLHSADFREAFTLQASQLEHPWSKQEIGSEARQLSPDEI